jgi:hypothetical protein
MIAAYYVAKGKGLENVKLGNIHVFAKSSEDVKLLVSLLGARALG